MRDFLAFLEIDDVELVYAERLATAMAASRQGLALVHAGIDRPVARQLAPG